MRALPLISACVRNLCRENLNCILYLSRPLSSPPSQNPLEEVRGEASDFPIQWILRRRRGERTQGLCNWDSQCDSPNITLPITSVQWRTHVSSCQNRTGRENRIHSYYNSLLLLSLSFRPIID